jgi:hypothetical protein
LKRDHLPGEEHRNEIGWPHSIVEIGLPRDTHRKYIVPICTIDSGADKQEKGDKVVAGETSGMNKIDQ